MLIQNPILRGMYPDPSICCVDGAYYLACSSFEYFPAVPIFKSHDLVTWEQIGNVLDRPAQLDLSHCKPSDGIFACTIRYHEGLFYMITTRATPGPNGVGFDFRNFFVTATDPAGPWSDPVYVDIQGIDPSLYWEDGRTYVHYAGRGEIFQVEIDGSTGEILDGPHLLTRGTGGRDTEGPHMWVRDGWHYLLLAEGGTREGHMATLMRGRDVWGPFEPCPYGAIMTNRELPREPIQRTGHTDWVVGPDGRDYLVALGVREIKHRNLMGRETCITPAHWTDDGWLLADGQKLQESFETLASEGAGEAAGGAAFDGAGAEEGPAAQGKGSAQDAPEAAETQGSAFFKMNAAAPDWSFELDMSAGFMPLRVVSPRRENRDCYEFSNGGLEVRGNGRSLSDGDCPFWALRQPEADVRLEAVLDDIEITSEMDEAGIAISVARDFHLSLFATMRAGKHVVVFRRNVGDLVVEDVANGGAPGEPLELAIEGTAQEYRAFVFGREVGKTLAQHVTVEVAGTQNTGVVDGIYVAGKARVRFSKFKLGCC